MRCGIIVAAALIAIPFATAAPRDAQAQEYCGFLPHLGAVVQCGYSDRESCENTIGKGAMCFVNPYVALNDRHETPFSGKPPIQRG